MSKSRQTRRSGATKRTKRPSRPALAPLPRTEQQAESALAEAPARRVAPASRPAPTSRIASAAPATTAGPVNFGQEYHYVLGDLKRIAVLAAVMFAALVGLALILT